MNNQVVSSVGSTPTRRRSRTLISTVSPQMPLIGSDQVSNNYPVQQLHRQSVASRLSPMVVAAPASPAFPTAFVTSSTFPSANCVEATQRLVQQIKPGSIVLPHAIVPPLVACGSNQPREKIMHHQIDQLTQQMQNFDMVSKQKRQNEYAGRGPAPKEIRFDPPWMHRIGQLQNVVEVLRRYAGVHLKNKNSFIVRCFAQSSAVYMELVFSLINTVISELDPDQRPLQVEPILLNQHGVNCLQPFDIHKCKVDKVEWTDTVLIRVPFKADYTARLFQVKFNRLVPEVFDKISVRTPFAHPDFTRPERDLRFRLQVFCKEKNVAARAFQTAAKRDGFEWTGAEQYFHNGVQLFKKSYLRMTAVKLQPETEIQHLHSIVASLKKYSQLYEEKKLSAIIQNFPRPTLMTKEMDMEQLKAAVYRVVLTNEFQESCPGVKDFEITRVMRNPETAMNTNQQKWHHVQRAQLPLVRVRFESAKAATTFIRLFEECNAPFFDSKMDNSQAGNKNGRKNQPFAHKDLTPPELALGYALKQYCRERNKRKNATNSYVYTRHSKVFEKRKTGAFYA